MAGRVSNNEFPLFGRKKTIGNINCNALFSFGGKPVNQQGKIDIFALRAHFTAVSFKTGQLVFKNHFAVIKQAPDERGLAVVNRTAGDEPQHGFVAMLLQICVDIFADQSIGFINSFGTGHQK